MKNKIGCGTNSIFDQDPSTQHLQATFIRAFGGSISPRIASSLIDNVEFAPGTPMSDAELDSAIRNNDIVLAGLLYRPVLSPHNKVTGFEGLPRFHNRANGKIEGTSRFAESATRRNKWKDISRILIEQAVRVAAVDRDLHISLNLSARMIDEGETLVRRMTELLDEYDVAPSQVTLELLEKINEIDTARAGILERYKEEGILIAIDDYGSGNSEALLRQMQRHRIPVDTLKIASHITKTASNGRVELQRCLHCGSSMGIKTYIAEGSMDHPVDERTLFGLQQTAKEWRGIDIQIEGPVLPA